MKRIETANRDIDLFGPGKDGFRAAVPGVSDPTLLSAKFFNYVQEALVRLIEHAGLVPGDDYDQFVSAIDAIVWQAQVPVSATRFGASRTATTAANKTALQAAIAYVDSLGGGIVVVPGGINYGYNRADTTTFPDFTGRTTSIMVLDYGIGNSYTGVTRDGSQVRRFFYTPNPGMSDGNGYVHRASWHPYFMLSSDNTGTRDTSDPYRASIFWEANGGPIGWRLGMRDTSSGATGTTIEQQTSFGLSVEGNFIKNGASWTSTNATIVMGVDRYTGKWAFGSTPNTIGDAYGFLIRNGVDNSVFSIRGETSTQVPTLFMGATGTGNSYQVALKQSGLSNVDISSAGTLVLRYDTAGHTHIGGTIPSNARHSINGPFAEGAEILQIYSTSTTDSIAVYAVAGFGANNAGCAAQFGKNNTTGRSINAGGTVNASGADYAEYMVKSDGCGAIAAGEVCGITADGKLTKTYAGAVSFLVKSTNPSYVGGDTWGAALGRRPEAPDYRDPEYAGAFAGERPCEPAMPAIEKPTQRADEDDITYSVRVANWRDLVDTITARYEAEVEAYPAVLASWDSLSQQEAADREAHALVLTQARADHAAALEQWTNEATAFDAQMEAIRQTVDRVAFAGQVPVNVQGALPGQFIVPAQDGDGIKGIAKNEADLTLTDYMRAVGKVIAIEADGRARIIVKVA